MKQMINYEKVGKEKSMFFGIFLEKRCINHAKLEKK